MSDEVACNLDRREDILRQQVAQQVQPYAGVLAPIAGPGRQRHESCNKKLPKDCNLSGDKL